MFIFITSNIIQINSKITKDIIVEKHEKPKERVETVHYKGEDEGVYEEGNPMSETDRKEESLPSSLRSTFKPAGDL